MLAPGEEVERAVGRFGDFARGAHEELEMADEIEAEQRGGEHPADFSGRGAAQIAEHERGAAADVPENHGGKVPLVLVVVVRQIVLADLQPGNALPFPQPFGVGV